MELDLTNDICLLIDIRMMNEDGTLPTFIRKFYVEDRVRTNPRLDGFGFTRFYRVSKEFWPAEMARPLNPMINGVEVLDTLTELSLQVGDRSSQFGKLTEGVLTVIAEFTTAMPNGWPEAWQDERKSGMGKYFYSYPPKWPRIGQHDPIYAGREARERLGAPSLAFELVQAGILIEASREDSERLYEVQRSEDVEEARKRSMKRIEEYGHTHFFRRKGKGML